jgi:uncharacterized membrane protein
MTDLGDIFVIKYPGRSVFMAVTLTNIVIIALIFIGLACFMFVRIIHRKAEQKEWHEKFIYYKNKYLRLIHIRNAKNTVREHPENAANVIRTWLSIRNTESSPEEIKKNQMKGIKDYDKTAMLCIALGSKASAEIFKYLRKDEIEILTQKIMEIEKINYGQRYAILKEFMDKNSE